MPHKTAEARRKWSRKYRKKNKAAISKRLRAWYLKNRDHALRKQREYVAANRERVTEAGRLYRMKNKAKIRRTRKVFYRANKGYGFFYIYNYVTKKSESFRAHIVSWTLAMLRAPGDGMTLDHKCWNKRCIWPSHLEEVSRPENTSRMRRRKQ